MCRSPGRGTFRRSLERSTVRLSHRGSLKREWPRPTVARAHLSLRHLRRPSLLHEEALPRLPSQVGQLVVVCSCARIPSETLEVTLNLTVFYTEIVTPIQVV